jgi:hypothetical protein
MRNGGYRKRVALLCTLLGYCNRSEPDAFFRTSIVLLETAGKGKYDLRIVLSLETQEILSVSIQRSHG